MFGSVEGGSVLACACVEESGGKVSLEDPVGLAECQAAPKWNRGH